MPEYHILCKRINIHTPKNKNVVLNALNKKYFNDADKPASLSLFKLTNKYNDILNNSQLIMVRIQSLLFII